MAERQGIGNRPDLFARICSPGSVRPDLFAMKPIGYPANITEPRPSIKGGAQAQ